LAIVIIALIVNNLRSKWDIEWQYVKYLVAERTTKKFEMCM